MAPVNLSITASFLLISLSAAALAQTAPTDNAPAAGSADASSSMEPPEMGDHWTYEIHDNITGALKDTVTYTITDVTPAELATRLEWLGKFQVGNFVYDHSWNLKTNQLYKFSPNDGTGVKLPLKVGNSWNFQSNDVDSAHGVTFKRSGSSKVVASESITTGAGTFDTFKIEASMTIRNPNDPAKKTDSVLTSWYAPSVYRWVKQNVKNMINGHVSQNISVDLVDYGRR